MNKEVMTNNKNVHSFRPESELSEISLNQNLENYLKSIRGKVLDIDSINDTIFKTSNNIIILAITILMEAAHLGEKGNELKAIANQMKSLSEETKKDAAEAKQETQIICKLVDATIMLCKNEKSDSTFHNHLSSNLNSIIELEKIIKKNDQKIQLIFDEVHLLSLNTTIKAYHLGSSGNVLYTITESMESILVEMNQLLAKSKIDMEDVDKLMLELMKIHTLLVTDVQSDNEQVKQDNGMLFPKKKVYKKPVLNPAK